MGKDVVEFELRGPYKWIGGSVTLRLQEGRLDGEPIYFVRTDSSDEAFAKEVGLVFVPLLGTATKKKGATGRLFLFGDDAADGQLPVLTTGPGGMTSRRSTASNVCLSPGARPFSTRRGRSTTRPRPGWSRSRRPMSS